jgi:hypothetical protein
LAGDPEYLLSEYTWYILKQLNRSEFDAMWSSAAAQFKGFAQGLKFYFTCSYLNDPRIGKNYYALVGGEDDRGKKQYLFNLAEFRAFDKAAGPAALEPHELGEIWGGALWGVRKALGQDKADRIILQPGSGSNRIKIKTLRDYRTSSWTRSLRPVSLLSLSRMNK